MAEFIPNQAQKEAIETIDGPVLVLAGPGTGKTQLLSARVAHILEQTDTPASAILCLTFTETGANAMRDRLTSFIKEAAYQVEINTYHGFSQTIINQNHEYFLEQNLDRVADFITQFNFIKEIQSQLPQNNILKKTRPQDIIGTIGELKQAMISPDQLLALTDENQAQREAINKHFKKILADFKSMPRQHEKAIGYFTGMRSTLEQVAIKKSVLEKFPPLLQLALRELKQAIHESTADEKPTTKPLTAWKNKFLEKDSDGKFVFKDNFNDIRLRTLQKIYSDYNQKMTEAGLYDFNDMILKTIEAIENNPDLKFNLQEKYLYILLDEYQDTNQAQSRLIELLTDNPVHEGRPNVMAVGDDDQAIYAFQGALFSNMVDFYNTYRDTKLINLTENYRSHADILATAKNIAEQIEDRLVTNLEQDLTKDITAANSSIKTCLIERIDYPNSLAEFADIAKRVQKLQATGEDLNEIAILSPRHKHLERLAPYLANLNVPIRYEKSENVLDNLGIKLMLSLAKLVSTVADRRPHNDLLFEVLSYPIWQLDTPLLWNLAWQAGNSDSWLDFILKTDDFAELRPIVYWVLEFAKLTNKISLEANFDYLIGNIELNYQLDGREKSFKSPIRDYYQNASPSQLINFVLDVNLLRKHYVEYGKNHRTNDNKPLEQLIRLVEAYNEAEEKMSRTNSYNEGESAVNLMTAFGAKGLEFKHVFLLETNDQTWGRARSNSNKVALPINLQPIRHDHETMDEKARLLFVAITRAKSHLYLMNSLASLTNKSTKRLEFLQEVEEDEVWTSKVLPDDFAQIKQVEQSADADQLETNLFDNFTAWQERHLKAIQDFPELLAPRLERFKLSATGFNNYTDLMYAGPKAYFLDNVLGFPGNYNIHTIYGTTVHYVLNRLQNDPKLVDEKTAIELFKQKLNDFDLSESDYAELLTRAERSLPKFITERQELFTKKDGIEVKTEESYYSQHIVLDEARLTGTIDRLEINKKNKTITIIDFKTGGSFDKFDSNHAGLYRHLKQLYFYRLMLLASKKFEGYKIDDWRLEFVDPDKTDRINFIEGEFDQTESDRIQRLIQVVWQKTMKLDFDEPAKIPGQWPSLAQIKQFEAKLLESTD